MSKIILSLLFLWTISLGAQNNCTPTELYSVKASSGMKLRMGPSSNQQVVVYVPANAYLLICQEKSDSATFENIHGHWRRARYENKYGYIFDGFLKKGPTNLALNDSTWQIYEIEKEELSSIQKSRYEVRLDSIIARADSVLKYKNDSVFQLEVNEKIKKDSTIAYLIDLRKDSLRRTDSIAALPPPPKTNYQFATETYNYCGNLEKLDPSKRWYGYYYDENTHNFKIRTIELQVVMSKYSLGKNVEFDIKAEHGTPPHFMLGTDERLDTTKIYHFSQEYISTHPQQLFPGQKTDLYAYAEVSSGYNLTLFATGNVTNVGICPEMTDYKLKLTGEMNDQLMVQDITEMLEQKGKCGLPQIYWFGDINNDNYPDFILAAQDNNYSTFTLFMSDLQDEKTLVRKAATWTYSKCE